MSKKHFHSVILDKDKCKGCTNCLKKCPTEAIRIRNGKAKIIKERCIDCGECIKICPYHAKSAVSNTLDDMKKFKYNIVLPAPSFYVQFKNINDVNVILTALKKVGFDEVFEVAKAAELITEATVDLMKKGDFERPMISSACPAVVRLIKMRFPDLLDNLVPLMAPMQLAAMIAKNNALEKTGLKPDEIGIFFITPCAAKITSIHTPLGIESSLVDMAIPSVEMYKAILPYVKSPENVEPLSNASLHGINWAKNGGESAGLENCRSIYVDGIHNVIQILEKIENETIKDVDFVEACSCTGGCVGGPLNFENPFVAKSRFADLLKNTMKNPENISYDDDIAYASLWTVPEQYNSIMRLDDDMVKAMEMMEQLDRIDESLPGLDCGSCGAPSCRALAEDIVRGKARESSCIFKLRERVKSLADEIVALESYAYGQGNKHKEDKK